MGAREGNAHGPTRLMTGRSSGWAANHPCSCGVAANGRPATSCAPCRTTGHGKAAMARKVQALHACAFLQGCCCLCPGSPGCPGSPAANLSRSMQASRLLPGRQAGGGPTTHVHAVQRGPLAALKACRNLWRNPGLCPARCCFVLQHAGCKAPWQQDGCMHALIVLCSNP